MAAPAIGNVPKLNPYVNPGAWGHMRIGGMYVPGIIESIDGAEKPERWIFQMGVSVNNATSVWRGRMLAESIKIKTILYDRASFDLAYDFERILNPSPGRKPPVLSIVNAHVNFLRITRVARRNTIPPKWIKQGNFWVYEIEVCEFNPVKLAPVGPAEAPKKETENDRLAKEVQRLATVASKL
jgi:hypothetical protein